MNNRMIVQAWKDPEYRARLSLEQRAVLPDNPSGRPLTELDDSELEDVTGGESVKLRHTDPAICCFLTYVQCPTFSVACRDLES
ncbi:mersacidin/lichenicidin family type 2 lantibiotic [Hyalangium gracile]|uniref:mersacidin/lichenicidin family type 2 lantibiotic n=1 Tax=Hyalangium gracile TaxID=394092 RepID=UPI001CC96C49|nr:mersacidin/lichenicidin family type 2 lantibiotic [Hyalangium gracile]